MSLIINNNKKNNNIEELEINISSGTIRALTWGPKDGMPILATHGWLDNAASFIPLAKYLTDYRMIVIDLPGHGLSDHKPKTSYVHFTDYIPDIVKVANKLKLDRFALLGHSLGASIYTLLAGIVPERITHLALIDALGPYTASSSKLPEVMASYIHAYERLTKKMVPEYSSIEEAKAKRLKASPMKESSVEYLIARGLKLCDDGKYRWRTDPRLLIKSLIMLSEEQVDAFLENITAPTCLIRPDGGWPFTEESFTRRTKLIKKIDVHRIPGMHHVHMDEPKVVAEILNKFFS